MNNISGATAVEIKRRFVVLMGRPPPICRCSVNLDALPGSGRMDMIARCVSSALFLSNGTRRDCEILLVFSPQAAEATALSEESEESAVESGRLSEEHEQVLVVRVNGDKVRHLRPDERSISSILLQTLFPVPCTPAYKTKRTKESPTNQLVPAMCVLLADQVHMDSQGREAQLETETDARSRCTIGVTRTFEPSLGAVLANCAVEACGGVLLEMRLDAEEGVITALSQLKAEQTESGEEEGVGIGGLNGVVTFVLGDDQGYDKAAERALELSGASRPVRLGKGMLLTSHCQVIIHSLLDEM